MVCQKRYYIIFCQHKMMLSKYTQLYFFCVRDEGICLSPKWNVRLAGECRQPDLSEALPLAGWTKGTPSFAKASENEPKLPFAPT